MLVTLHFLITALKEKVIIEKTFIYKKQILQNKAE